MFERKEIPAKSRVVLTKAMLDEFFSRVFKGNVPELSAAKGLPYDLVYNLVKGRIRSLSVEDYRAIFGVDPPRHAQKRLYARYFRGMVKLWIFLNDRVTEADLFREFNKGKEFKKIDYRVFAGDKVKTVDATLERWMEQKFLSQGFSREDIEKGISEMKSGRYGERIPYMNLRPLLQHLEKLGVSATKVLNQWAARYESGELKNVPKGVYERALKMKVKAEKMSETRSGYDTEKLKEEIYGPRKGFVLFSEVEEELRLLRDYGRKSLKRYLGRSIRNYEKGLLKRISQARAKKIKRDFELLLKGNPPIPTFSLPVKHQARVIMRLLSVLFLRVVQKLIEDRDGSFEDGVLQPSSLVLAEKRKTEARGFTPVSDVPAVLSMSHAGFDALLATHSDLFKRIGKYEGKWFFADRYLEELLQREGFAFVRAKYEWLAKRLDKGGRLTPEAQQKEKMPGRRGASAATRRDEAHGPLRVGSVGARPFPGKLWRGNGQKDSELIAERD